MDVLRAVSTYVDKIVTQTSGLKVLLLDADTTPVISLASTTSHLLSHEVYLTDRIDNTNRERMPHLKCLAFLRPSAESLAAIERELERPKYGGYWLFFTNALKKSAIERLAEADEHEVVKEVQEYFADYCPITASHFSLNLLPSPLSPTMPSSRHRLYSDLPTSFDMNPETGSFERHVEGLMALLLSLKKKPVIRYERMSNMAKKLGSDLLYQFNAEPQLFDFRPAAVPPLLLILDRRNDPVTPLLSQWTYQAMVHELIGITNGRVDLSSAPDITNDLKEIVLSPEQDPFFARHLYDNFGDLGAHVKTYVSEYQTRSSSSSLRKIETVGDMKRFVEEYPEFRKLGGNVSKHVALVGELSRIVSERKLLEVSEVEQSLATTESHANDVRAVQDLILSPATPSEAKLRLALLYALRYQKYAGNNISQITAMLPSNGVPEADAALVNVMLNFAGAEQRQDDLFANENFFSRGKSALKGLKGVDNVYTQHTPHLAETVDLLLRGRLKDASYPFLEGQPVISRERPQDIILFMIGGTTYEEARSVAVLNAQLAQHNQSAASTSGYGAGPPGGTRILLGGTGVINSKTFLAMLHDAATRFPPSMASAALALRPTTTAAGQAQGGGGGVNLQLGNLSLSVGAREGGRSVNVSDGVREAGNALEAGVDAVRDGARNLLGKLQRF